MPFIATPVILAVATRALAATIPPLNTIHLAGISSPLLNGTSLEAIDPRFSVVSQLQDEPLNGDVFLQNVVEAMGHWANCMFDEGVYIQPSRHPLPGYPGVTVSASGAPDGPNRNHIMPRFLLWGLYEGVRGMIFYETFKAVEVTLKWEGEVVGSIKIRKSDAPPPTPGASSGVSILTLPSEEESDPPPTPGLTNTTNANHTSFETPDNHPLSVRFTHSGPALTRVEVILTILATFLRIAPEESDSPVRQFSFPAPAPYSAVLEMGPMSPAPPASVETFTYGIAYWSLGSIPLHSMRQRMWGEVEFIVLYNDEAIGRGQLVKGRS